MAAFPIPLCVLKSGITILSAIYVFLSMITAANIIFISSNFFCLIVAIVCYSQILVNWNIVYRISNRDKGHDGEKGNGLLDHTYCPDCKIHRQRLSHHCSLCGHCVLRHDHHCFFLGTCIGMNNQHHFTVFCLYTGLGTLYLCHQIYVTYNWACEYWYEYLELFLPFGFLFMLMKVASFTDVFLVLMFNSSMTLGLFCSTMFGLQVYLLATNQTWYQFSTGTRSTNSGSTSSSSLWKQFKVNFGKHGLLNFLIPFPNRTFDQSSITSTIRTTKICWSFILSWVLHRTSYVTAILKQSVQVISVSF